ncbi:peroxisomal bifunctional enzyme [Pseudochaenichthys georgianus]|uniref:peroxisomal bifunctional enzyme n=1 Tax=Pseudochaenichthys georgianus TaxID=52239 RepID=UPI00146CC34A|nr:peroxisomal bifunctional enzyme [Pseudochaenichthys georgianus]
MAEYNRVSECVGLITLRNPPVNALSAAVRQGIVDTVQRALSDPNVKSVVICGQNGIFCGGADIKEFGSNMTGPPLIPMIHAIESANKPVVAAIEGSALGGGLELALGCHYRIAHSKARLGLPEVSLGLLPAAGGSQRLPRLIGVPAALNLITTGRHVTAAEALQLGIVDQVTDHNTVDAAVKFALSVAGRSLDPRRISTHPCPQQPDLDALFEEVMQKVRQSARGAIAPIACVQAVRAAATLPYAQGMERERELMATLFTSGQARALQYCFFAERAVGRWRMPSGARWDTSNPRPVHKAAVIGLGTMGRGITVALAQTGLSVIAVETQEKQLMEAKQAISGMLERGAKRRGVSPALDGVIYSQNIQAVADVDLVIEAVFEDIALKTKVFQQLSAVCKPGTLLCTNTSALDVDQLASETPNPELVVGMHFFAPAHVMKLLEVVYGPRSSPQAVATAMQLGKKMGKASVAVGNCRGFVGNRMLKPYIEEAFFLLEEGATPELVDQALEEFGFPMGVFRMSDLSGLDVGWRVRKGDGLVEPGMASGRSARIRQGRRYSPLGDLLCEEGRFGQKTGRGWYQYDKPGSRVARSDPWLHSFLGAYRAQHGLVARRIDHQEVLDRCLYALINEGFHILDDGIAAGPEDIDVIYVSGYGWPRHRGGPMFYANMVGLAKVLERLEHYQQLHPEVPHLQPSSLLRRLVASGSPPIHKWGEAIKKLHSQL